MSPENLQKKLQKVKMYLSGDIEQFGTSVTLTAEPGEPLGAATADCGSDGNGLDIVDSGRAAYKLLLYTFWPRRIF